MSNSEEQPDKNTKPGDSLNPSTLNSSSPPQSSANTSGEKSKSKLPHSSFASKQGSTPAKSVVAKPASNPLASRPRTAPNTGNKSATAGAQHAEDTDASSPLGLSMDIIVAVIAILVVVLIYLNFK